MFLKKLAQELKVEKENIIENIKFLEYEYHDVVITNNSLTLELDQLGKILGSQNEVFHPSSKILNEMTEKC